MRVRTKWSGQLVPTSASGSASRAFTKSSASAEVVEHADRRAHRRQPPAQERQDGRRQFVPVGAGRAHRAAEERHRFLVLEHERAEVVDDGRAC